MTQRIGAMLALLLLAGCAGDPAPVAQLQLTEQALQQARAMGATGEPEALSRAEAGLAGARQAFEREEYRQARMLAERADLFARRGGQQSLPVVHRVQIYAMPMCIADLRTQLEAQP